MNNTTKTHSPIPATPLDASTPGITASERAGEKHRRRIVKTLTKRSFCTLSTSSPAGKAHVAGVIYQFVDGNLWVHSMRSSRKARSIAANGTAAVCVPFRRLPAGPPFTIHFQGRAEIVDMDTPEVEHLVAAGALKKIAGHGALDEPDGCFIRITPNGTLHSYGPGASIIGLIRDPLNNGAGRVRITS